MQVGGVDARGLKSGLGDVPCRRSLGRGDVHVRVFLLLVAQLRLKVEPGQRRGQDEDTRDVHAERHSGHALTKVGTLATAIGGSSVIHEGAVYAAAHDDAARHRHPAAFHADRADLGAVLDDLQGVTHNATRALHRVRNDQVCQCCAARESVVTDGRDPFGQHDARE